jgi:hypothetical protein
VAWEQGVSSTDLSQSDCPTKVVASFFTAINEDHKLAIVTNPGCQILDPLDVFDPTGLLLGGTTECSIDATQHCVVGDLTSKGYNQGTSQVLIDNNLSLFGPDSIIGRSLVLFNSTDGSVLSCSEVTVDSSFNYGSLNAMFDDGVVSGNVTFKALLRFPRFGTRLFVSLSNGATSTYSWMISDTCSSSGSVFDPFNVLNHGSCNPHYPVDCAVGDLTGKLGAIAVDNSGTQLLLFDGNIYVGSDNFSIEDKLLVLVNDVDASVHCARIYRGGVIYLHQIGQFLDWCGIFIYLFICC